MTILEPLDSLFLATGFLAWFLALVYLTLWVAKLAHRVIQFGCRRLFGKGRGSAIWQEPVEDPTDIDSVTEAHFPSWAKTDTAETPLATPVPSNAAWAAGEVPQAMPTSKEPQ